MKLYGSLAGFKYCIRRKPFLGAYAAMETFGGGLLTYGDFDEYHAYYDQGFLTSLTADEMKKAYFRSDKLKILKLKELVRNPDVNYSVIHCEEFKAHEVVVFRNMLSRKNIPVTRRAYTIATIAHLREFLNICLLGDGERSCDSIVVPSTPTRDALLTFFDHVSSFTSGRLAYKGRIDVIPHGIDIEEFRPRDSGRAREKFGIAPNATVLLSMARISCASKMNYDHLLEFFRRLMTGARTDLLLVLAGADPHGETQRILDLARKSSIADNVKMITDFEDRDKADILSCADIFISLSDNLQESFGIALIEAMAAGLPVICTDWDGHKDIVDDGVTGYRIPTVWTARECRDDVLANFGNPYGHSVLHRLSRDIHIDMELLTARALELINNREARRAMGRNALDKAVRAYSVRTEILKFQALWQELAEIAERDERQHRDLGPLLNPAYLRYFRSYPTLWRCAQPDVASDEAKPRMCADALE